MAKNKGPTDTLYTLCRSADNRHAIPVNAGQADEIIGIKKAYFAAESEENPLVREILNHGRLHYDGIAKDDKHGILCGPATFFRTHEILRKTRSANRPITIGEREYPHDDVVKMLARCIPNIRLTTIPWFSPDSYRTTLSLAWLLTLLTAYFVGFDSANRGGVQLDGTVLYYMGISLTVSALIWTALRQNRDVRYSSPWNSAMYLDLNAELLRRDSRLLAVARKELIPLQRPFKQAAFYYPLARHIENGELDGRLTPHLADKNT